MPEALTYDEVLAALDAGAMLIDGRDPEDFARGHLEGALNVGLEGRYAEFAGSIVAADVDIVLFVDEGFELEGKTRLARIGFDRVVGYVAEPSRVLLDHADEVRKASRLTGAEFDQRSTDVTGLQIVDVRNAGEFEAGSIPGAELVPVGQLPDRLGEFDPAAPTVVYCAGGYRSSVAASVLRQRGFADVSDIIGGYGAWAEQASAPA
jgi:rhodanese-related sulfurtransferase